MAPSDGFSFLTRGEDGIWRRRSTAIRAPRQGEEVSVSVTTYPGGGSAYASRSSARAGSSRHPTPPSGPKPPSRDKPAGYSRSPGVYHLRRPESKHSSAAVSANVYGRNNSGRASPYGMKGHAYSSPGSYSQQQQASIAHVTAEQIKARMGFGGMDHRPLTANTYKSPGTYSASGTPPGQMRGGYNFRTGRYAAASKYGGPTAPAGYRTAFMPTPPSASPTTTEHTQQQQQLYGNRRGVYSAPGAPDNAAPSSSAPASRTEGAWTDVATAHADAGNGEAVGPKHTSLTPAKIVADLHMHGKGSPDAADAGAGSHERVADSAQAPSQEASPPKAYSRAKAESTPATGGYGGAVPAYGRSHVSSYNGYGSARNQEAYRPASSASAQRPSTSSSAHRPASSSRTSQAPLPAGESADGSDGNMGMIPGYSVSKLIGEGGFCQVRLGIHHLSNRKVAIKMIEKGKLTDSNDRRRVAREIKVLKRMADQNIIKLFEVIDSPAHIYVVMEHSSGGSLLDYVRGKKRLSEKEACWFFKQIIHGLEFCHSIQVVHRDIKLENILLDHQNNLKLIDFGLSTFLQPGKLLRVHCGSPSYAAPEIVGRKLYEGPPVDVWSSGIVLFAMMAGYLPFHAPGSNKQELCQKILRGVYKSPESMSFEARDLIQRMLTLDPADRITIPEIWEHPWVKNGPVYNKHPDGGLYNIGRDPFTGAVKVDDAILKEMEAHGFDQRKTLEALIRNDANYITATYFLLAEGRAATGHLNLSQKTSVNPGRTTSMPAHKAGASGASGVDAHRPKTAGAAATWDGRDDSAMGVYRHGSTGNRTVAVA